MRYTICRFYPNIQDESKAYEFAVLGASDDVLVLSLVSLSDYGIKSKNPIVQHVIENTASVLRQRIDNVLETSNPDTGYAALERIASGNVSSIQFGPITEAPATDDVLQQVMKVFASEVLPRVLSEPVRRKEPRTPKMRPIRAPWRRSVEPDIEFFDLGTPQEEDSRELVCV